MLHSITYRSASIVVVTAIVVLFTHIAPADSPATLPTDSFQSQLAAINAKSLKITDLKADFVQEKHSPLLRKPLVSRGTVFAKGANSLWDTTSPQPTIMASDPHFLRLYFPDRKTVEEYPVRSQLGMLAASPLPSLDAIRQNFTLAPDAGKGLIESQADAPVLAIRMTPSNKELQQYVDHVRVLLDEARGVVLAFEMTDPDGEITVIRFSDIQTDTHMPDSAVHLNLPPGVKTVRPLGDAEANHP